MNEEIEKNLKWVKCPDCGFERYIRKDSPATGICKACLPKRMAKANTLSDDRIWFIRKDGRREQGFKNKCQDCGIERIEACSRKNPPKRCEECRKKVRGKDHPNYIDGEHLRHGSEIRELREIVLKRDGNICKRCGINENLEIHHIVPWKKDESKRFDPENCEIYCKSCHLTIERTGRKASAETTEKLRKSHKGYKTPEEQKRKQSESLKAFWKRKK